MGKNIIFRDKMSKEQAPLLGKPVDQPPTQEDPVLIAAKKRAMEPPLGPKESLDHLRTNFQTLNLMQLNFKKSQLAAIKRVLKKYEAEFFQSQSFENDCPKNVAYMQCMLVYDTVDYLIENLNDWAANQGVNATMVYFPSKNYVKPQGKGVTCIFGSYKLPLSSVLVPLLYGIASGNCCLIKGSYECPETIRFLKKLANEAFDPRFYKLIEGDSSVDAELFGLDFDGFYYTGNTVNSRDLLGKAGKNLVPCTVDIESKCPTVIESGADLDHAARVIASHAFMNGGLMPYNTDLILVDNKVYEEFKKKLVASAKQLWGGKLNESRNWSKVLNDVQWERLVKLTKNLEKNVVWQQGTPQKKTPPMGTRFFPPTILEKVSQGAEIMKTVVNGPILCLTPTKDMNEVVDLLRSESLKGAAAIYYFGTGKESGLIRKIEYLTRSGS